MLDCSLVASVDIFDCDGKCCWCCCCCCGSNGSSLFSSLRPEEESLDLRLLLDLADFVDLVDFAEEAVSERGKGRAKDAPLAGGALDCLAARPGLAAPGLEPSLPIALCVVWVVLCFTGLCCLALVLAAHPTVFAGSTCLHLSFSRCSSLSLF